MFDLPSVETVYQRRRKRTGPRGFRVGRHLRYDPAGRDCRLMTGHVQGRWYRTESGPDGKARKVKTERCGSGLRYRARYVGPDGTEKAKNFPDRQKRLADQWLAHIEADMARGRYIDPRAARITFQQYAERRVATQGADPNTQASRESQLRLHTFPYFGSRPLGSFQPAHIRTGPRGGHVWRTSLNEEAWKPALAAAGVIPVPGAGPAVRRVQRERHARPPPLLRLGAPGHGGRTSRPSPSTSVTRSGSDAPRVRTLDADQ